MCRFHIESMAVDFITSFLVKAERAVHINIDAFRLPYMHRGVAVGRSVIVATVAAAGEGLEGIGGSGGYSTISWKESANGHCASRLLDKSTGRTTRLVWCI